MSQKKNPVADKSDSKSSSWFKKKAANQPSNQTSETKKPRSSNQANTNTNTDTAMGLQPIPEATTVSESGAEHKQHPDDRKRSKRSSQKKSSTGYSRIVGKRRLPENSRGSGSTTDANMGMSTISSMTDRFRSFLNGESDAVSLCNQSSF